MKKVINGRRYDTEKATKVGEGSASCSVTDFSYWTEELYQKRNGEFFLHGQGGPMTRYARRIDTNSWSGGEELLPLTADDAKAWAERNLDADEYEAIFGEVAEDDSRVHVTMSLSARSIELLKRMASETGKTRGELLDDLIAKAAQ